MPENKEPFGKFDNKFLEKLNKSLCFHEPRNIGNFCTEYCDKRGIDCNKEYRRYHRKECKHIKEILSKNYMRIEKRSFEYCEIEGKEDIYYDSSKISAASLNRENFLIKNARLEKFDNKIHNVNCDNRKHFYRSIYLGKYCYSIECVRCAFKLVANPEILFSFKPDIFGNEDTPILVFRNDKITYGIAPRINEVEEES